MLSPILRHKTLLAFLVFCFLFLPFSIIKAQQYSLDAHQNALSKPGQSNQKFNQGTFAGFINSANTALIGCGQEACPPDLKVGAIPVTSNLIAGIYSTPPASGLAYVQDVIHRFNPVQPAYAQTGTGFNGLAPLLSIWKAFRNFAYIAFAIVFIAIGLAIMFRMKLDPRTVITIQSAIPRIIVSLLLVTFSYAIAGFMIDLLYVAISLVVLLFVGGNEAATADLQNQFTTGDFRVLWNHLWGIVGGGSFAIKSIALIIFGGIAAVSGIPGLGMVGVLVGGGAGLVLLIVFAIILYILVKLFIELLKAYIGIILAVVLGPLQIAIGTIPGLPGFGSWLKGLFVNLSIFVAVIFVLLLGGAITKVSGTIWSAPLLAGGTASILPTLIALGTLLIVHQVPQAVRSVFTGRPLQFAIGEALGPARAPFGMAATPIEFAGKKATETGTWVSGIPFFGASSILRKLGGGR